MIVKCPCQHCNGHIEFEADGFQAGTRAECPHCHLETVLFIPAVSLRSTKRESSSETLRALTSDLHTPLRSVLLRIPLKVRGYLAFVLLAVGLSAWAGYVFICGPHETLITGKIFIVTKGRQNVTLGDEKIALLDGRAFRQLYLSNSAAWSNALILAQANVLQAEANYDALYRDDLERLREARKQMGQLDDLTLDNVEKKVALMDSEYELQDQVAASRGQSYAQRAHARQIHLQEDSRFFADAADKLDKCLKIRSDIRALHERREQSGARKNLDAALEAEHSLWETINWPSPDDFSPSIEIATSDNDGRFSFHIPKRYVGCDLKLLAKADRLVGEERERYWWIARLDPTGKPLDVLLSNDNTDDSGACFALRASAPKDRSVPASPMEMFSLHYVQAMAAEREFRLNEESIEKLEIAQGGGGKRSP